MTDLSGKHALVTGGGSGIGWASAQALRAAGATVTITGRRLGVLQEAVGESTGLYAQVMDVSDEASVQAAMVEAAKRAGPIDILVVNAGIAETAPTAKTSLDMWRRVMATNLDGAFLCCREVLPHMLASGWGRIISVASVAGLRGAKYTAAYAASKHGLIGLTRVLSEECMGTGITANALCPGFVRTPIVARSVQAIMARSSMTAAEAEAALSSSNRHGRLIEPEEVAAWVLHLCADAAGSVSGQTIEITGGQA